jgi:hypothetical protein
MIALFLLFLAIPTIATIDYFVFSRFGKCDVEIKDFIIPTFLEISLFITGFWLGSQYA